MSQVSVIGIVGGGQLARMMAEAAVKLNLGVIVLDPGDNCPAAQVGAKQIIASMDDPAGLRQLAEASDVITIDVEHVDASQLAKIAEHGTPVRPLPSTITTIQDKYLQKQFLINNGIAVADSVPISDKASAQEALAKFSGKMLIKTRFGAYDGRGNMVIGDGKTVDDAFNAFGDQPLYAEKFIPFIKELAVMIARDLEGNTAIYPVVETIQNRNICEYVLAPAQISSAENEAALELANQVADHLDGPGIYGIEMFLTDSGEVMVNEIAPRVHNSGHYTIEACNTSQFEQHIRAISGLPLGSTDMKVPAAVMLNVLGKRDGPTDEQGIDKLSEYPHTYVHLYGKSPTKLDRKMGHITITADSVDEAYDQAKTIEQIITI